MWEWSKLNSTYIQPSNTNLVIKNSQQQNSSDNIILTPKQMYDLLEQQITFLGLKNISLKSCKYYPQTWAQLLKNTNNYQRMRKNFLKFLGYSQVDLCHKYGLSDEDINLLKKSISPENYNTHIKIPFDFGGELNFENLCLIKTHPIHDKIHSLIELQISNCFLQQHKVIYIPYFEGYLYNE